MGGGDILKSSTMPIDLLSKLGLVRGVGQERFVCVQDCMFHLRATFTLGSLHIPLPALQLFSVFFSLLLSNPLLEIYYLLSALYICLSAVFFYRFHLSFYCLFSIDFTSVFRKKKYHKPDCNSVYK